MKLSAELTPIIERGRSLKKWGNTENVKTVGPRSLGWFNTDIPEDIETQLPQQDKRFYNITKKDLQIAAYKFAEILLNIVLLQIKKWPPNIW